MTANACTCYIPQMLHKFQKLTAGSDSGRVKGLFLSLPPACLPRLIAFGAHPFAALVRPRVHHSCSCAGVQSEEPSPADYGMVFRGTTAAAMFSESKRTCRCSQGYCDTLFPCARVLALVLSVCVSACVSKCVRAGSPMPTVAPEFEGRGIWYERGGFAHARIERAVSPSVRAINRVMFIPGLAPSLTSASRYHNHVFNWWAAHTIPRP